jgi:hypothetical protein
VARRRTAVEPVVNMATVSESDDELSGSESAEVIASRLRRTTGE